jgi:prophage antirepressor-like protein
MVQANVIDAPVKGKALIPAGTVKFHGKEIPVYRKDDVTMLAGCDLGRMLGFSRPRQSMSLIWTRNTEELTPHATVITVMTVDGKNRKTRVFSETGAYIVAMFADTPVAKEVRLWLAKLPKFVREDAPTVLTSKPIEEPRALSRRTTAAERNPLAVLVNQYLGRLGPSRNNYTGFWRKTFHPVFGVNTVEDLTVDQLPKAIAFMEALLAVPSLDADMANVDAAIKANYEKWLPIRQKLQNDVWKIMGDIAQLGRTVRDLAHEADGSNVLMDNSLAQQAALAVEARCDELKAGVEALQPLALIAYSSIATHLELKKSRQTLWGIKRVLPQ